MVGAACARCGHCRNNSARHHAPLSLQLPLSTAICKAPARPHRRRIEQLPFVCRDRARVSSISCLLRGTSSTRCMPDEHSAWHRPSDRHGRVTAVSHARISRAQSSSGVDWHIHCLCDFRPAPCPLTPCRQADTRKEMRVEKRILGPYAGCCLGAAMLGANAAQASGT